mgnify:CR=1 FL=1
MEVPRSGGTTYIARNSTVRTRRDRRAMAATTKELQHKLAQVVKHEAILHATAERLHLHGAALERQVRAASLQRSHPLSHHRALDRQIELSNFLKIYKGP